MFFHRSVFITQKKNNLWKTFISFSCGQLFFTAVQAETVNFRYLS